MFRFKLILPVLFLLLALGRCATAQAQGAAMTNNDVIALAQAGLGDDIVIAKIQAAPSTNFDTSVGGLTALKKANVSPAVVRAMINPHPAVAAAPGVPGAAPAGDPNDPTAQHAPGLYLLAKGADGHAEMTRLERATPRGAKNSGMFLHAITQGIASSKTQSVLDGSQAAIATPDPRPVFYAYIPESNSSFVGGMSVKDLTLTRLEVKGDTRLWTYAAHGLFDSNEIGSDQKDRQGFTTEEIKPGVYKLTPAGDLTPGQYAFRYSGAFFFDFGIQPRM